ncbi:MULTISPECIES: transporter substrate-binding domain-containing protein [Rhodomicrobium]|uniref:transporter substrate-binding domain-containing protein n=1 Tax=Rhodomicrobium TaxID=1068 RepID=UPI001483AC8D|nr:MULTISPECIES: transporter substrate-binding domain-containing protein [Rhodomicrobium]
MRRLSRRLAALVLGTLLLASGAGTAQETAPAPSQWREESIGPRPDWSWLLALRFVTETDYPPFNYRDEDGTLTGFNVDLARAICRELEVNCEVNSVDWARLIPALKDDEADAVIASLAITPGTIEQVDFTDSYYATPAKFVVRNASKIESVLPDDLEDLKIGVVKDTAHEVYLRSFFPGSEIVTFASDDELRQALKQEKIDLLFGDAISLMFWINGQDSENCCQFRGRGFMEAKYFGEGVGIAVTKGNIRLKEVLNYALARVRASGRMEELLLRYFPLAIY